MTVYIVTEGIYSDYRIEKVFSTREQAEMYCAAHEEDSYSVYHIEEYVVDDVILESASEVHYLYYKYTGGPLINNKFELKYTLRPVRDWEKTKLNNSYYPGYKYSIITDHKTGQKELEEMLKKWEKFIKDEV